MIMQIRPASDVKELAAVRTLFEEYSATIRVELCFQGFGQELATLPGSYAPPRGRLLLAGPTDLPAGCVGLRPAGDAICEMKRLFVRPTCQGRGLGRALAERAIAEARTIGYSTMVLDSLPSMQRAIRLYEALGFVRRSAYYVSPLPGTVFMELSL